MMRRLTEQELAREPARALASMSTTSPEALAAELLASVAQSPEQARELQRRFWRTLAARRGTP